MLGMIDKIFLNGKFGLAKELESGIAQISGLVFSLVGIMCLAPLLGMVLTPVISPVYSLIGADPANFPGIILGPDGGAYSLAASMTEDARILGLSGLFLSSILGVTVCFSLPFALGVVEERDKETLSKGMLAGIISSPVGAIIGGLIAGYPIGFMFRNLLIAIIIVVLLVIGIIKAENAVVKGFMIFSKIISTLSLLSLAFACFELLTGIKLIPGLGSIDDKFNTVGYMGVTVAGALCMILILQRILKSPMGALGKALKINDVAIFGIVLSAANAMPVYSMMKDMDERGKLYAIAFSVPACYALGAHLAFTATVMPEAIFPQLMCKLGGGVVAIILARVFFGRHLQKVD